MTSGPVCRVNAHTEVRLKPSRGGAWCVTASPPDDLPFGREVEIACVGDKRYAREIWVDTCRNPPALDGLRRGQGRRRGLGAMEMRAGTRPNPFARSRRDCPKGCLSSEDCEEASGDETLRAFSKGMDAVFRDYAHQPFDQTKRDLLREIVAVHRGNVTAAHKATGVSRSLFHDVLRARG